MMFYPDTMVLMRALRLSMHALKVPFAMLFIGSFLLASIIYYVEYLEEMVRAAASTTTTTTTIATSTSITTTTTTTIATTAILLLHHHPGEDRPQLLRARLLEPDDRLEPRRRHPVD